MLFVVGFVTLMVIVSCIFPPALLITIPLLIWLIRGSQIVHHGRRKAQEAAAEEFHRKRREKVLRSF
jgi:hypothetical protein